MWKEPTVLIGPGGHAKSVEAALAVPVKRLVAEGEDEAFVASYAGEPIIVTVIIFLCGQNRVDLKLVIDGLKGVVVNLHHKTGMDVIIMPVRNNSAEA